MVEKVLRVLGVTKTTPSGNDWVMASCPLAPKRHEKGHDHSPSLAVCIKPGPSFIKCHACGVSGTLRTLIRAMAEDELLTAAQVERAQALCRWSDVTPQEELEPDTPPPPPLLDPRVLRYLGRWHSYYRTRGLRRVDVQRWRLGYRKGALYLPCVLPDGTVPYVQVRLIAEKRFWWMPKGIRRGYAAGTHLFPRGTVESLVVTEGIFDAVRTRRAVRRLGWKHAGVIALFGSKPPDDVREHLYGLVKGELILATDNDEAGDLCAEELEQEGRNRVPRISRVQLPSGVKDPGEASLRQLMAALDTRHDMLRRRLQAYLPHP